MPEDRFLDLTGTDLRGSNLSRSTFNQADYRNVILFGADLRGADLHRADLSGADLCGVNLELTKGLTQERINEARGDKETKLPEGLQTPEHWLKDSGSQ